MIDVKGKLGFALVSILYPLWRDALVQDYKVPDTLLTVNVELGNTYRLLRDND